MKTIHVGKIFGLEIDVLPLGFIGTLVLWILITVVARSVLGIPFGESLPMGFLAVIFHWIFEFIHNLGHAAFAKRTGYPMLGITFGRLGILALSRYPQNEPTLPPSVHILRALGGPIFNGVLSVIFYLLLPFWDGNWFWLGMSALFENLTVYTLQVFLPLGFNDGATILRNVLRR